MARGMKLRGHFETTFGKLIIIFMMLTGYVKAVKFIPLSSYTIIIV